MKSPAQHEREAMRLRDIASALDAGLPTETILPGIDLAQGLATAIAEDQTRGFDRTDRALLEASETAGTMPAALRLMAEQRERQATFLRQAWSRLRYPLLVLLLAILAAYVTAPIRKQSYITLTLALVGIFGGLALVALWLRSRMRRPNFQPGILGPLQQLLQDIAEVPYLQAMLGLYGAGVTLQQAHPMAADACSVPYVRYRLRQANAALDKNQPLIEALTGSQALCLETQQILAPGEVSGELEDALSRALQRRRDTLDRRLDRIARLVSATLYGLVMIYAGYLVLTFYIGYFDRLRLGR